jgi:uncharacterized YccA/Bax inhibitor family protein
VSCEKLGGRFSDIGGGSEILGSSSPARTEATINGSGAIGIGFSVVVVIIAALNLVLDFDFIENGARYGAPKYMEWYALSA